MFEICLYADVFCLGQICLRCDNGDVVLFGCRRGAACVGKEIIDVSEGEIEFLDALGHRCKMFHLRVSTRECGELARRRHAHADAGGLKSDLVATLHKGAGDNVSHYFDTIVAGVSFAIS